jgi:transcriptional regulator with XRE-family HTH domain
LRKLADNLKISRHKAGLTQEQVANKLGLSIGTISIPQQEKSSINFTTGEMSKYRRSSFYLTVFI